MKEYNDMTPIELNVLIKKAEKDQVEIKAEIFNYLDEITGIENKINTRLDDMKKVEDLYVELMSILMSKQ